MLVQPGRECNIIVIFSCQMGVIRGGDRCFLWRAKDKGHILQQGEVLVGTRGKRKKSVHSRAVKRWKRLPRAVAFPSSDMLKA